MGAWHACDELARKPGVIRKYTIGHTFIVLKDEKVTIWGIKYCPYCGIKLEDLK